MRSIEEAECEARRIGFQYGDSGWKTAVDASMRGFPAWRIAQYFDLSPDLIYTLGGPVPQSDRHGQ
jgi:hypothetical protein